MADDGTLAWRVKQLEDASAKHGTAIARTDRKLERLRADFDGVASTVTEAHDLSTRVAKSLDEKAAREAYAAEDAAKDAKRWQRYAEITWYAMSLGSFMWALLGGYLHSAWTQALEFAKGLK